MAKAPSKEEFLVGKDHMIQLILQHLHYEGLVDARKMLEEEAGVKCKRHLFSIRRVTLTYVN